MGQYCESGLLFRWLSRTVDPVHQRAIDRQIMFCNPAALHQERVRPNIQEGFLKIYRTSLHADLAALRPDAMLPNRGQPGTRARMRPGTMRYNRAADYTPGLTWSSKARAIWMSEPTSDPPGATADASRSPVADALPTGPRWIAH